MASSFIQTIRFLFLLLLCFPVVLLQAQSKTFRRHFLIAYDISYPFIQAERSCPAYSQALNHLFTNHAESISGTIEAYQNNIGIETTRGIKFFDKERDEISFFHFNIAGSEFQKLRWAGKNNSESEIVTTFNGLFLKDKASRWSDMRDSEAATPGKYFSQVLALPPDPRTFSGGVSMSNFVYPLVMGKVDENQYAEEYILIILSDFLTGSALGNTKDLDRVRDIFQVPYGTNLPDHSPVSYIKNEINYLHSQYYRIDFFQYSFRPRTTTNAIGILGYKIKPKAGALTPEDISFSIDDDLSIHQRGYESTRFRINATRLKFTHNPDLVPQELLLSISIPDGKNDIELFNAAIATLNEDDEWESDYTGRSSLMEYDEEKHVYTIPSLFVRLDPAVLDKDFSSLRFRYEIKTQFRVQNEQPVNFLYATEREITPDDVHYTPATFRIVMLIVLPILALAALIVFLAFRGRPVRISLKNSEYLDSYEVINYKTVGKLTTDFRAWDSLKDREDPINAECVFEFRSSTFPFNWKPDVSLSLEPGIVPQGFELFLKTSTEDLREFGPGNPLMLKKGRDHEIKFIIGLRQNDVSRVLDKPEPVKIRISATAEGKFLFLKSEKSATLEYYFHIGPDMGDVWVGFDPGTSGSCVAAGNSIESIRLGRDKNNEEIVPSVLVFEKAANYQPGMVLTDEIYKYGFAANLRYGTRQFEGFRSIKKLLGYRDLKTVAFDNGHTLHQKGTDLAALLVEGFYNDASAFFSRPEVKSSFDLRDKPFDPRRAVIAIPNNFTISKIQDMVDCLGKLNKFREIRYVYEAEAVLFYYLSNFSRLSPGEEVPDSENVLVFDMGGATINATVVTATRTQENGLLKYDINFSAKIGYGIGGDSIDYCLVKYIIGSTYEFPEFAKFNLVDHQAELTKLAFDLKMDIIEGHKKRADFLMTADNLSRRINNALGTNIRIDPDTSDMYKFFQNERGHYKFLERSLLRHLVYNNIIDAVQEVLQLSGNTRIDKIIFSGRSTAFPLIKESVIYEVNKNGGTAKPVILDVQESKTAVALGACWYGINRNSVRLNNLKTNAAFGFRKTMSADKTDVQFHELISMGKAFHTAQDGIDSFTGSEKITDNFAFDGGKVAFFQIMGKDAEKILAEEQKHKFSKIAYIQLPKLTSEVGMKVDENDQVECAVILESGQRLSETGVVSDQDIGDANEEHYTWTVK